MQSRMAMLFDPPQVIWLVTIEHLLAHATEVVWRQDGCWWAHRYMFGHH